MQHRDALLESSMTGPSRPLHLLLLLFAAGVHWSLPGEPACSHTILQVIIPIAAGFLRAVTCLEVPGRQVRLTSPRLLCVAPAAAYAQQQSQQLCSSPIRQVACYYDTIWTAVAGISLQSSTGSTQTLCRTEASPGTVIDVPEGVGIAAVTVTSASASRRVIKLEFRWVASQPIRCCCCPLQLPDHVVVVFLLQFHRVQTTFIVFKQHSTSQTGSSMFLLCISLLCCT